MIFSIPIYFLIESINDINKNTISHNKIVKILESPDKKFKAIAFIRDLGATTSFSPQVSILENDDDLEDQSGNLFIGDNSDFIDISWKNNDSLNVIYSCQDYDIFKKVTSINNIEVKYEKVDRSNSK